jgi:hypothetical protein
MRHSCVLWVAKPEQIFVVVCRSNINSMELFVPACFSNYQAILKKDILQNKNEFKIKH